MPKRKGTWYDLIVHAELHGPAGFADKFSRFEPGSENGWTKQKQARAGTKCFIEEEFEDRTVHVTFPDGFRADFPVEAVKKWGPKEYTDKKNSEAKEELTYGPAMMQSARSIRCVPGFQEEWIDLVGEKCEVTELHPDGTCTAKFPGTTLQLPDAALWQKEPGASGGGNKTATIWWEFPVVGHPEGFDYDTGTVLRRSLGRKACGKATVTSRDGTTQVLNLNREWWSFTEPPNRADAPLERRSIGIETVGQVSKEMLETVRGWHDNMWERAKKCKRIKGEKFVYARLRSSRGKLPPGQTLPDLKAVQEKLRGFLDPSFPNFKRWLQIDATAAKRGFRGQTAHLDYMEWTDDLDANMGVYSVSIALDSAKRNEGAVGSFHQGKYRCHDVKAGDVYVMRPWTFHNGTMQPETRELIWRRVVVFHFACEKLKLPEDQLQCHLEDKVNWFAGY